MTSAWLQRTYVVLVAFVACVWLNQSVGGKDWEDIRDRVFAAPAAHPIEAARYPFVFLYRRSLDERYYFETSAAVLGKPADEALVRHMHGKMPASFDQTLPPADGHWHAPYTEVPLEYPPLNLPFFVAPRMLADTFAGYGYLFGGLMGLCLLGSIFAGIDVARRGGCDEHVVRKRWLLATGLLLAQGALAIQRLDPIATLFLALAVRAAVRKRPFELGLTAGLAGAAKILPLLVLPAMLVADRASFRDARSRARLGAGLAVALVVGFGPMVLSSGALASMMRFHGERGLNVEATLGVAFGIVQSLAGHAESAPASFGSQNLEGAAANLLAKLTTPLLLCALGALVWAIARAPVPEAEPEKARITRITASALAATAVVWLGSKVLSPQYLTWSIPLVLAIPGRQGLRLVWIAIVAMVVTQLYTRGYYDLLVAQRPIALATLAVRQGLLFGLLVLAVRGAAGTGNQEVEASAATSGAMAIPR